MIIFIIYRELVGLLQQKNVPVYLISGGFRGLIGPIAIELSIPLQHIHANKLKFFLNGENYKNDNIILYLNMNKHT